MDEPSLFHTAADEPLAARMRPRTLDEFIGQNHILGPGRLLRRAIEADQLSSLIFYGPPGTGKTTLARVIANSTRANFTALNAVLSGVKDIREAVAAARDRLRTGRRTILFVDEVHRFNKAQQDALLPWVENGTVILIGATTENPYFEVNKALVSRSRIFQLTPLDAGDLRKVAAAALADVDRGFGRRNVVLADDALEHLANVSNGDARALLNALELAVLTTPEAGGAIQVTREVAEESIQKRAVLYDKEGDAHFDTVSAFIKSVRGSDPDAALYWLAKMVYAGEDPRFILRRLLILAAEDVGLADPGALSRVVAAAQAFEWVGLPEGRYHLAQATLDLANAPKSNSTMAFFDALAAVEREREADVPNALRDASRDAEGFGHGAGYLYPHAYRDHWVAQQYLPAALQGKTFYQPSDQGAEAAVRTQVARRREAQLAAMLEERFDEPPEILTSSPDEPERDRWLRRTLSGVGARLGELRDAVLDAARIARHHVVLDLAASNGLLTWEALRRTPEGQVWAVAVDASSFDTLQQQAAQLPELARPVIVPSHAGGPAHAVAGARNPDDPGLRFDALVGRNAFLGSDVGVVARQAHDLLASGGSLSVVESVPLAGQRLHELVDLQGLPADAADAVRGSEEAARRQAGARFRFRPDAAADALREAGFVDVAVEERAFVQQRRWTQGEVLAWFARGGEAATLGDRLAVVLDDDAQARVRDAFLAQLVGRDVPWRTVTALIHARMR